MTPERLPAHWSASPAREAFERWVRRAAPARLAVAYSGGADSTSLLIEAARWRAGGAGQPLLALHVHHGLQPEADRFVTHCERFCALLGAYCPTRLVTTHARVELPPGASVEAQARAARYAALVALARAHGVDCVLLAHQADDQAETLLIALGRGAGVAGIAAMAPEFERDGVRFSRPLLDVPAPAIRRWLRAAAIDFVDDPSNDSERFTRNRLRAQLMPALEAALPRFRTTVARSARLARQAQTLLDERAREDLQLVDDPPRIDALQRLSAERQANVLRYWLRERHRATGSEAQMSTLLRVIAACRTRAQHIRLKVGRGYAVRDGARLDWREHEG